MVHREATIRAPRRRSNTVRSDVEADQPASSEQAPRPQTWFQWLLLYPALAISVITAAPTWFDAGLAAYNKIEGRSFSEAKVQSERWAKNLPCTALPLNYNLTDSTVRVDATICNSGDIFVRAATADHKSHFYWVPVERIIGEEVREAPVLAAAHAAERPTLSRAVTGENDSRSRLLQRTQNVICPPRFLNPRQVLRRIITPQGCFDQVVDTYTGQVISMQPAPCAC